MIGASRTALLVAAYRARATERYPALCQDPWAARLAGEEGARLAEAMDAVQRNMEQWVALRTAWLDARVARHTRGPGSFGQVVLLGAGLDTRPVRQAWRGVTWFEVDHPASLAVRQERLRALGDWPGGGVPVACDFEREDFVERAVASGLDPSSPALLIWEGVSYYLPEPAVLRTFERVRDALHPASRLLFDHVGERMARGTVRNEEDRATRRLVSELGEPLVWGVDDLHGLLAPMGFGCVDRVSFEQLRRELVGGSGEGLRWHRQWMAEVGVAREGA